MIACPEHDASNYLKVLSQIFRLLSCPGFKDSLLNARTPAEAIDVIATYEDAKEEALVLS
jgi:mannitol/fructose-specific phosphotransferase system IIA component (Ntr-type)